MSFQIKQEKFEGPLDLLLELIEKQKLSISEISLARVTDEYLAYIKEMKKIDPVRSRTSEMSAVPLVAGRTSNGIDPEQLAEFLVVAAHLMLIKSRSLLPVLNLNEEEKASIEELEKRLKEYKRIKELAMELKILESGGRHIFTREAYAGMDPIFYPPKKLTLPNIAETFASFLAALPKIEKLAEDKIRRIVSLEEKISHIKTFLQGAMERVFSEVVRGTKEKVEIIVSFLALLELSKQKFVELSQKDLFEDITIKKV